MQDLSTWDALAAEVGVLQPRERVIAGMARALVVEEYNRISVVDIVRHAKVSKRTFYEHFKDKEDCFLATYSQLASVVLMFVAEAARLAENDDAKLEAATSAYLTNLSQVPSLARAFLLDVQAAGPRAMALQRSIHNRYAEVVRMLADGIREPGDCRPPLPRSLALAFVGGVNELVLDALDNGDDLNSVHGAAVELARAILLYFLHQPN